MNYDKRLLIPLNLHFFDAGEKTEKPTARKRNKAREEGQVAKSQEVGTAFLFLASFIGLRLFAGTMLEDMMELFTFQMETVGEINVIFEQVYISRLIAFLLLRILLITAPMFILVMVVGVAVNLVQVGWKVTTKPLMPKFSKMNPIKGFKNIFSMRALVTLGKSILKFVVVGYTIYMLMMDRLNVIPALLDMTMEQAVGYIGEMIVDLGITVGVLYLFIAAADYAYTRYKHTKDLKMTKQEVKEEFKQTEGNPQIKGRIRRKMQEVSMRRMMQGVPKADVIITNPTHYAVALRYDRFKDRAPVLVAKGVDFMAKRIKEKGREHNVEIVENPPLARTIYKDVEIGQEIPPELFQAVADIIVYVFKLRNKI